MKLASRHVILFALYCAPILLALLAGQQHDSRVSVPLGVLAILLASCGYGRGLALEDEAEHTTMWSKRTIVPPISALPPAMPPSRPREASGVRGRVQWPSGGAGVPKAPQVGLDAEAERTLTEPGAA